MVRKSISATDLATLGRCERQAVLDARYGKIEARSTEPDRQRGNEEHQRHHVEVKRYAKEPMPTGNTRCFIATAIYGPDAWQTWALRGWRDRRLLPSPAGRILVRLYYAVSPWIARQALRRNAVHQGLRFLLDRIVRWIS